MMIARMSGVRPHLAFVFLSLLLLLGCSDSSPPTEPSGELNNPAVKGDTSWVRLLEEPGMHLTCYDAIPLSGGDVLLAGRAQDGISIHGGFLLEINEVGHRQWFEVTSFPIRKVTGSRAEGFATAGHIGNGTEIQVALYDARGGEVWSHGYGGHEGRWIVRDGDDGYVIAGSSYGGMRVVAVAADGTERWHNDLGAYNEDVAASIAPATDGGWMITGTVRGTPTSPPDLALAKLDSNGGTEWTRVHGDAGADYGNMILAHDDGGYLVAGAGHGSGSGNRDAWLMQIDDTGSIVWDQFRGLQGLDEFTHVKPVHGGFIVTGSFEEGQGDLQTILGHYSVNGAPGWLYGYGLDTHVDSGVAVVSMPDNGLLIVGGGWNRPGDEFRDIYLIKTYSDGSLSTDDDDLASR